MEKNWVETRTVPRIRTGDFTAVRNLSFELLFLGFVFSYYESDLRESENREKGIGNTGLTAGQ